MNRYKELQKKHSEEIQKQPLMFAFSNEQFYKGLKELGLEKGQENLLCSLGFGGYMKKSDYPAFAKLSKSYREEEKKAMEDDDFLYEAFRYELANHEYAYTYETEDAIEALGLTVKEVYENERLKRILIKACDDIKKWEMKNDN